MKPKLTINRPPFKAFKQFGANVGWWYEPVYSHTIHLLWGVADEERLKQYVDFNFVGANYQIDKPLGAARCISLDGTYGSASVIVLRSWKRNPFGIGTLVHECFHATEQTLDGIGLKHSFETSEAYAYLLDYYVNRALTVLP